MFEYNRVFSCVALTGVLALVVPAAPALAIPARYGPQRQPSAGRTNRQDAEEGAYYKRLPPWTARKLFKQRHHFDGKTNLIQFNSPIQHVVVIVMENRTPDNLFSGLYSTQFGQSSSTWGSVVQIANPAGTPALAPIDLNQWGGPGHEHYNFQGEANLGPSQPYNPNWASDKPACKKHPSGCVASVLSYVNPLPSATNGNIQQIWPYQFITENFSSADNMFQANQGPSLPAHQYLIAGQSGGYNNNPSGGSPSTFPYALAGNNAGGCGQTARTGRADSEDSDAEPWHTEGLPGCQGSKSTYCMTGAPNHTSTVDMEDNYFAINNLNYAHRIGNPLVQPCESYNTILDLLTPPSQLPPALWEFHAHAYGSYWNAPALVSRFAGCTGSWGSLSPPPQCNPVQQDVLDPAAFNFVTNEVPSSNIAAVTYLTPCPADSDHPNSISETGPSWVAWIVNAIGQNPNLWPNTAVLVVWDDWGGWYDHIPPAFSPNQLLYPQPDANEWGYRVPFLVVSAYPPVGQNYGVQGGFVSHQPRSMSAILTFIEKNFSLQGSGGNLGSLNADDAVNDPLSDLFDFTRQAKPWPVVPTTVPFTPIMSQGSNPIAVCAQDPV